MRIRNEWNKGGGRRRMEKMENKIVLVGILTMVFTVLAVSAVSTAVAIPIPDGYDAIIWFCLLYTSPSPRDRG